MASGIITSEPAMACGTDMDVGQTNAAGRHGRLKTNLCLLQYEERPQANTAAGEGQQRKNDIMKPKRESKHQASAMCRSTTAPGQTFLFVTLISVLFAQQAFIGKAFKHRMEQCWCQSQCHRQNLFGCMPSLAQLLETQRFASGQGVHRHRTVTLALRTQKRGGWEVSAPPRFNILRSKKNP
ncbi:hypothetical protein DV515_00003009 [Chloebia gouldiae]|uniref:Uncharacterized protein n=1 Tax=Chloebia gouldiae TaxID=44316 RepID=A0A3L8SWD4_CHLGU|nr:hypothetical protein DV515_00003009 [Chloebia gouldiae]